MVNNEQAIEIIGKIVNPIALPEGQLKADSTSLKGIYMTKLPKQEVTQETAPTPVGLNPTNVDGVAAAIGDSQSASAPSEHNQNPDPNGVENVILESQTDIMPPLLGQETITPPVQDLTVPTGITPELISAPASNDVAALQEQSVNISSAPADNQAPISGETAGELNPVLSAEGQPTITNGTMLEGAFPEPAKGNSEETLNPDVTQLPVANDVIAELAIVTKDVVELQQAVNKVTEQLASIERQIINGSQQAVEQPTELGMAA